MVRRGLPVAVPELGPAPPALTALRFVSQVMLQLEKKLFDYSHQEVFRDNNGTAVSLPRRPWPTPWGHLG